VIYHGKKHHNICRIQNTKKIYSPSGKFAERAKKINAMKATFSTDTRKYIEILSFKVIVHTLPILLNIHILCQLTKHSMLKGTVMSVLRCVVMMGDSIAA